MILLSQISIPVLCSQNISQRPNNRTIAFQLQDSQFVVRVNQTYYGGIPPKTKKKVAFNLLPNSVISRPLKCISSILKRDNKFPSIANSGSPNVIQVEKKESRLKRATTHVLTDVPKDDFASICLKAAQDFVVVKEIITNSTSLQSSTSFTLRTKESLLETNEIAGTMRKFYTSPSLPEHSYNSLGFKLGTRLLEMRI